MIWLKIARTEFNCSFGVSGWLRSTPITISIPLFFKGSEGKFNVMAPSM